MYFVNTLHQNVMDRVGLSVGSYYACVNEFSTSTVVGLNLLVSYTNSLLEQVPYSSWLELSEGMASEYHKVRGGNEEPRP